MLIKSIYGLISDLCTYILHKGDNYIIVTVWVDELLLFITMDKLIKQTKVNLEAKWELTNLGEPVKIIRIEITLCYILSRTQDSLM